MNQQDVKDYLLKLESDVADFSVVFSGKSSKKVNGLYKPDSMEILIHNKNFDEDNALLYTAIHEYAHHVHFTSQHYTRPNDKRAHTIAFRTILHRLLGKAEEVGIYKNVFDATPEFVDLTKKIKDHYLHKNASLMKDFGRLLIEAITLCEKHEASFDDYVERSLAIHRSEAKSMMKVFALDLDPKIGLDNMKLLSNIKDADKRSIVQEMIKEGKSQDETKYFMREDKEKVKGEETIDRLLAEKKRIERSLEKMQERLSQLDAKITHLEVQD